MKVASLEIDLLANVARLQQDMNRAQGVVGKSMGAIEKSIEQAKRVIGSLGVGLGVGALLRQATQLTDAYTNLHGQLKNATRSQAELGQAMGNVRRIATIVQAEIQGVGTAYARLSNNLRDTGASQQKVADITETVALALKVNGASVAETTSAMQQLSQAFGKGKLDGDEFRTLMEASPNVMRRVAEGMRVPFGSLKDLAAQGKITAQVLANVLSDQTFLASVREQAKEMQTIGGALIVMKNALLELVGTQAKASGFVATINAGIGAITDNLEGIGRALLFLVATAIPAAVKALWTLTTAMLAVPGMALVKILSVAAGALVAFGDKVGLLKGVMEAAGLVWVAFVRLLEVGWGNIKSFLDGLGSMASVVFSMFGIKASGAATTLRESFEASFLAVAGLMDDVYEGFTGNLSAISGAFQVVGENIWIAMKWGFDKVLSEFSEMTVAISGWMNETFSTRKFSFLVREDPGSLRLKSITEEAQKAYEAGKKALGMRDALVQSLANRTLEGLNDAFDVPLVDAHTAAIAGSGEAAGKANSAYQTLIASIRSKIEENKLEAAVGENATESDKIRIKVIQELTSGKLNLTAAQKAAVDQALKVLAVSEKELVMSKLIAAADKQKMDLSAQAVKSAYDEARKNQDLVQTYGMSKDALEQLTIARLEDQLAQKEALKLTDEQVKAIELLLEAHKQNASALVSLEGLEKQKAAWEEWKGALDQVFQQVGQALTDRLFEGGKSGREMIKDLFKTLTLRLAVQPVMMALQGSVQGMLGGALGVDPRVMSASDKSGGVGGMLGMASNLQSLYGAVTGGLTSTIAGAAASIGSTIGSSAVSSFAAGMQGSTLAAGLAGPTTAGASGAMGLGATFGAALPWIGGALAVGSLLYSSGIFGDDKPKTRHSQRARAEMFGGGAFSITERDSRQAAGSDVAAAAFAQTSVAAANELFRKIGVDAAIDSFYALMESSVLGDRNGVASGGSLRIGGRTLGIGIPKSNSMTLSGVGGWSSAEMLPRLQTDIQLSMLEAFQKVGDQLPRVLADIIGGVDIRSLDAAAAQQLAEHFFAVTEAATALQQAVKLLPFEQLRDLSFDAAAGLVAAAGGLEQLTAGMTSYHANFYSDAERFATASKNMAESLASVGVVMPALTGSAEDAKAAYRALVESFDVTTEAGQRGYAVMIGLSGGFAELVGVMGQLNEAARTAAVTLIESLSGRAGIMPGMTASMTDAQESAAILIREIAALSNSAADAYIDFAKLEAKLADIDTDAFVATIVLAFENIGQRITELVGDIANERMAVRSAALGIINPGALTPEAIRRQIAGINTTLPGNAGVVAASNALNQADAIAAQRKAQEDAARNAYMPAHAAFDAAAGQVSGLQAQYDELFGVIRGKEAEIAIPRKYSEGRRYVRELQATMPGLYDELNRLGSALNSAKDASSGARWNDIVNLSNSYAQAVAASASAQAAANAAAMAAKTAQTQYADALQGFAVDASKSVSKLADLREQTVKYYQAQKQLADLMANSAASLRQTSRDFRISQLDPEDQFRQMQNDFGKAYSLALSTDGETLAGYADKLNGLMSPLLMAAQDMFATDAQYNSFVAQTLARVEAIAGRLDVLAPAGYEAESLALLGQIDATLAALDKSARSAEALIVNAVNIGRDATVNGLRQITNAITGNPVAAFASGGMHMGGMRLVGERGPELEVTGPSRIYNANQTRSMLSGGDSAELAAEVRALRAEVVGLRAEARATAVNTGKVARQGERAEVDGILVRTDSDTPLHVEAV